MYLPSLLLSLSSLLDGPFAASQPLQQITANASLAHLSSRSTWTHLGCYADETSPRVLPISSNPPSLTPTSCQNICSGQGYTFAGVEYGQECWCGNSVDAAQGGPGYGGCTMACNGDSALTCGGNWAIDVYELTSAPPPPGNLATSGWTSLGCVQDGSARALTGPSTQANGNTVESCQTFCAGWTYAGMEYGDQCYCGNTLSNGLGTAASPGGCNMACAGNAGELCGGNWLLNLYKVGAATTTSTTTTTTTTHSTTSTTTTHSTTPTSTSHSTTSTTTTHSTTPTTTSHSTTSTTTTTTTHSTTPTTTSHSTTSTTTTSTTPSPSATGGWTSLGCVTDGSARALTGPNTQTTGNTVESCQAYCKGYTYAGMEYGDQCYCGNSLSNGLGTAASAGTCNMACAGNSGELCGGNWALNLYKVGAAPPSTTPTSTTHSTTPTSTSTTTTHSTTPTTTSHSTTSTTTTTTTTTTHTTTSTTPSASPSGGWTNLGCRVDVAARALTGPNTQSNSNTVESCQAYCVGYTYAGVEYGSQCFCGNALSNNAGGVADSSDCNMACTGNSAEICGGNYRLNVYSRVGAIQGGVATTTSTTTAHTSTTTTTTSAAVQTSSPPVTGGAPVVAHVIVGNTYPYTQGTWSSDIALALENGLDGFVLNYGSDSWQSGQLASAYAAAVGTSALLFLSPDMTSLSGNSQGDANNIANQVNQFINHPNQLKIGGKVVLSSFAGSDNTFGYGSANAGWQYVISQIHAPVLFIPSWFVDPSTFSSYSVLGGIFNWNAGWPMSNTDITWSSDAQWIGGLNGNQVYIAPVTPNFFTHYSPQTYNKNWIYRNDDNLYATRWQMLMQNRASIAIAEIISWNDYGESHYIGPIEGAQPNSQAWVNGYPHTAWLAMTKYFAAGFKTGSYPALSNDQIYMYARPHPKAAQACCDDVAQPEYWQNTDDNFYVVVLASSSGTVILSTPSTPGSSSPSGTSQTVNAGVNMFKLALMPNNGMRATLSRGGQTVIDLWPQDYTFNPNPQVYNFNAYVTSQTT